MGFAIDAVPGIVSRKPIAQTLDAQRRYIDLLLAIRVQRQVFEYAGNLKIRPVRNDHSNRSVGLNHIDPLYVDLVKAGKAPRIKQDEAKATYEGRCGPDNAHIDWGRPWQEIDRLIRGCNPAPGAWSKLDGATIKIFDVKPLPAKDPKGIGGRMGEIVAVDGDGFTVVCADGRFKVTRVQPADGKKIDAGEWVKSANVAVKARLA